MKTYFCSVLALLALGCVIGAANLATAATILVNIDSSDNGVAEPEENLTYVFTNLRGGDSPIPSNSSTDLANGITPVLISGTPHGVSGPITNLTNGVGANGTDDPPGNFFSDDTLLSFRISLNSAAAIGAINSYSWYHGDGNRAGQLYNVYGSATAAGTPGFNIDDRNDPSYALIAAVNTGNTALGSQQGVSIVPSVGTSLGAFQHFIFEVSRPTNVAGTFFSEIDIVGVPEPSSLLMASLGGLTLACIARRRRA